MINYVYIIVEVGVNYNGWLDLVFQFCNVVKDVGVDVVKFQIWKIEKIVIWNVELVVYQENNIFDKIKLQFKMLKEFELSYDNFEVVKNYCDEIGIQFFFIFDEIDSLDFFCNFNLFFIKLGLGDVINIFFFCFVGSRYIDVVFFIGMLYFGDVEIVYCILIEVGVKSVFLFYCIINYLCFMYEVNFWVI